MSGANFKGYVGKLTQIVSKFNVTNNMGQLSLTSMKE